MVTNAFFLLALSLAPCTTFGFVLPISEKDDGIFHIEDISLSGSKNAGLLEKLTQDLKNSLSVVVEESDSDEEDKKSIEVSVSVANIRRKDEDDDSDDKKDKSIPGKHNECAEGMIYLSELDICVDYNPKNNNPKNNNIYDIPQGDAPYTSAAVVSPVTYGKKDSNHNCKDGEIFLSELDICIPSNPASPLPPKNEGSSIYDIPQGDAPAQLVKPEASIELKDSNERKDNKKSEKNHGCDKDEVYLSELDICVTHPHHPAAPLPPQRVQSIYDIPQGDSPQAVSPLAKSDIQPRRKNGKKSNNKYGKEPKDHGCGKGELYLSELDICVPENNCYPYGTTCWLHKQK